MAHINQQEVEHFNSLASQWWDENGPLKGLHELNPTRLQFIKIHLCQHFKKNKVETLPFKGLRFCDVGCGGGLLSEPLTRLGASVVGVDASEDAIKVAKSHASSMDLSIDYRACELKDLIHAGEKFDAVLSLEVVEHVDNLQEFICECTHLLKPEGALVLSTLNKTFKSWALGIIVAENILKWAPKGAHNWNKFVSPRELSDRLGEEGLRAIAVEGMSYCPMRGWRLSSNIDINYMMYARL